MKTYFRQLGSGVRGISVVSLLSLLLIGANLASAQDEAVPERKRQVIPRVTNPSFGKVITISGRVSVRSISTKSPINTSHPGIVSVITAGDQTIVLPKPEEAETPKPESKKEEETKPVRPATTAVRRAYVGDY